MTVVTISGKARHGKDTIASMLKDEFEILGKRSIIIHYADLLKYICRQYFEWDGIKDERGRSLLQGVGTGMIRKKNPDFWVEYVRSFLDVVDGHWDYVFIPDTRFENEVYPMRNYDGVNSLHLRVVRTNGEEEFDNGLTDVQKNHISETELDNSCPDILIQNSGTLEDLLQMVKRTAQTMEEAI